MTNRVHGMNKPFYFPWIYAHHHHHPWWWCPDSPQVDALLVRVAMNLPLVVVQSRLVPQVSLLLGTILQCIIPGAPKVYIPAGGTLNGDNEWSLRYSCCWIIFRLSLANLKANPLPMPRIRGIEAKQLVNCCIECNRVYWIWLGL